MTFILMTSVRMTFDLLQLFGIDYNGICYIDICSNDISPDGICSMAFAVMSFV
jgi:hypothetical protein